MPISVADLVSDNNLEEIMTVDDALRRLEQEDREAADVVRLRFFAGLSVDETAKVLKRSARTVARDWAYARAWLHRALQDQEP